MPELSERVEVRMSREQKRALELRAKEAGLSVSQWIRRRLLLDAPLPPKATVHGGQ